MDTETVIVGLITSIFVGSILGGLLARWVWSKIVADGIARGLKW